ncbi:MAG TPA: tagaturonate epimerase family protein [Anaerolineae bacterium]|nr:tagaturonate epimerase family protein [Anaerolineae bacterium]
MPPIIYPESLIKYGNTIYALARVETEKFLGVQGNSDGLQGLAFQQEDARYFPLSAHNAAELRQRLPWLVPQPLALNTSMGLGDRLGLATPGHIQAVRNTQIAPIFAQQSVRENARTGRTPQQVLDDAMWGVLQCGWREAWGADADHLKTTQDIAPFVRAGYTFFTVDPGEHVRDLAPNVPLSEIEANVTALPWDILQDSFENMRARYLEKTFAFEGVRVQFTAESILRACEKYGRAVAHAVVMFQEIARQKNGELFDFEVSVDETETPTSLAEHFYIANELQRLNVRVTSLAPRFIGRFEKGVDYIGDLDALAKNLDQHAAVARQFSYKLSLHSGSDKLSVYPLFANCTRGVAHVKTAGTSYLEALRTIAAVNPKLFREILTLAREKYPTDRATYHVSADLARVRESSALSDVELPALLNEFDAREVLHVTFGSVIQQFGSDIHFTLRAYEAEYAAALQTHFAKHLAAFAPKY